MKGLQFAPKKVTLQILGERGFPLAEIKLPEEVVKDFNDLLKFALERDPAARVEDVVKGIWRHGTKSFWHALRLHKGAAFKYIPTVEDITPASKVKDG